LASTPIRFFAFLCYSLAGLPQRAIFISGGPFLMATTAQINANRVNAQLSPGPTSDAGKAISSKNALKTGLTGRTVLLPTEDAALYESHLASFRDRYQPVGEAEKNLVQSLADTEWRLQRIPSLEAGIYAIDRIDQAARQYIKAFRENRHEQFNPAEFGFEFSRDEIKRHALLLDFHFHCEYHRWLKRAA
jgi:hypothetical protein